MGVCSKIAEFLNRADRLFEGVFAVHQIVTLCLSVMLGIVVHQESVCATFGSGLSSTCVVDVGDQKTSVCCVEDGVSHRNTRYGSSPITVYANHHRPEIV